ncbi:MAG: CCA tRNA nucleotidyltransferase [Planctomycetota bacterium]|nr:CCA tRNA nucleotidyltransferase [Planctomycetota bacterium]
MSSSLNPIELPESAAEAVRIIRQLNEAGFTAYLAGGCVRDALLGKEPKDFDIATNASPEAVREVFGKSRTLAFGASFGVIGVLPSRRSRANFQKHATEVATFRSDGEYTDGRRPDTVEFGDARHDAMRRDFTINGLFYDPLADEVIDYVGGQADLADGLLRTIGNPEDRFGEDRLRMLRAIRFSASLGFRIDPATEVAIGQHAGAIAIVSEERVGSEMRRLLVAPKAIHGLRSLVRTHLAASVFPELLAIDFESLEKRFALARDDDFRYRLGAILSLVDSPQKSLKATAKSWRLANEEVRSLSSSLRYWPPLLEFNDRPWSETQPIMIDRDFEFILDLASTIAESQAGDGQERGRASIRSVRERTSWPAERLDPPSLLGGDDLKSMGFPAGPAYSIVLKEMRNAQLDGQIRSREEACQFANQAFQRLSKARD